MSLVFLKNRNREIITGNNHISSNRWTNCFNTPLSLPPNSQVAYISSTLLIDGGIYLDGRNNFLYVCVGNPDINPTIEIDLGDIEGYITPSQLVDRVNNALNSQSLQADWKGSEVDALTNNWVNGWTSSYDLGTFKTNLSNLQRGTQATLGVGWNTSYAPSTPPAYTGINKLGLTLDDAPEAVLGDPNAVVLSGIQPIPGAGATPADIGWSQILATAGAPLPDIAQAYQPTGLGTFALIRTNTGLKRSGLSGVGTIPNEKNNCVYSITNNNNAFHPQIANVNSIIHYGGLVPRYWNEKKIGGLILDSGIERYVDLNSNINFPQRWARYMFGYFINENGEIQAEVNTGSLINPQYSQVGVPVLLASVGGAFPEVGANPPAQTTYKWRWETPYAPSLYVCKDYDETTGDSAGNSWTLIYNFATGTDNLGNVSNGYACPSWFGDLNLNIWNTYNTFDFKVRGNFDPQKSYDNYLFNFPISKNIDQVLGENFITEQTGLIKTGLGFYTGTIENFNALGYQEKNIRLCIGKNTNGTDLDNFRNNITFKNINNPPNIPDTEYVYPLDYFSNKFRIDEPRTSIGYSLGFGNQPQIVITTQAGATQFINYLLSAPQVIQGSRNVNSVHIQLTNLPIQSMNSMIQSQVKDIAIVPCYNETKVDEDTANNTFVFYHQVGEKNWIDVNNIQTLNLSRLDVLLTYDNNTPAENIRDDSEVLIMFRQKPGMDRSLPLNIQTLPNQNPYTNTIQEI